MGRQVQSIFIAKCSPLKLTADASFHDFACGTKGILEASSSFLRNPCPASILIKLWTSYLSPAWFFIAHSVYKGTIFSNLPEVHHIQFERKCLSRE